MFFYHIQKKTMNIDTDIILYLMTRIQEKAVWLMNSEIKKKKITGILPIHGEILLALNRYGELSMKNIADIVNRKKSTVTTLVRKLTELDYVEKKVNNDDNRSYLISLTKEGKKFAGTLCAIADKATRRFYKNVPMEERKILVSILQKINDTW